MTSRGRCLACRPLRLLAIALAVIAFATVAPYLFSGTELVRLRNALTLGEDFTAQEAQWTPDHPPLGFKADASAPDSTFIAIASRLKLKELPDDEARAEAIVAHLHLSAPALLGGGLQSDLKGTYAGIVGEGRGYCGDFVRVFNAIGEAAGLQFRNWAFSFDGYGGHGHIFIELWSRTKQRWVLLDIYNNFKFHDAEGQAVSAMTFRDALASNQPLPRLVRIEPRAKPGYEIESKAWEYYRRGLNEWYMPWGVNPFDVDRQPLVQLFSGWSRSLEQLASIAAGVQPAVRLLVAPNNLATREGLRALRSRLKWGGALMALALLAGAAAWVLGRRARNAAGLDVGAAQREGNPWPVVGLVGPLPPPPGGMANQCEQLARLLSAEGAQVHVVRTNAPYWPEWAGRVPMLRAAFRLVPYLWNLWRDIGRCQVVHLFANSGLAWHLLAAPALLVARWQGVPVIVNYRGGEAEAFFARAPRRVFAQLSGAAMRVTPSAFLMRVFAKHGLDARVIPNIIDLARFSLRGLRDFGSAPHLVVTRNLEAIYDNATAIKAFARVRSTFPLATLTVAGVGPQRAMLEALTAQLGLTSVVTFAGRIDNSQIAELYASSDLMLNASTVDNMPISILEALACGVPVVSTSAGGIPDLVEHGRHATLVPVADAEAMATAALQLLGNRELAQARVTAGRALVEGYAWPRVGELWRRAYWQAIERSGPEAALRGASAPGPSHDIAKEP